jgi:NAD(P)-dependent dehydrogenase (short-subunit alcohol dehydrogenase family)
MSATHIHDSTGIGYATTVELFRHGATVYLACRNEAKALASIESMHTECPGVQPGKLIWLPLDLMDLESVVKAAETFMHSEERLDILSISTQFSMGSQVAYNCDSK